MNLISCTRCGVVLDKDWILFLEEYDEELDELCPVRDFTNGEEYYFTKCPTCNNIIEIKGDKR